MTESEKPRLINLSPCSPVPMVGGRQQRSTNLLLEQQSLFSQTLITTYRNDAEKNALEELKTGEGIDVRKVPWSPGRESIFSDALTFLRGRPRSIYRGYNTALAELLQSVLNEFPEAAVKLDTLSATRYLPLLAGRQCFLDQHNAEHIIWERRAELSRGLSKVSQSAEGRALRAYEASILNRMNITFAVSEQDAERFQQMAPKAKIVVVSNGVAVQKVESLSNVVRREPVAAFLGPMSYLPNRNGVSWFLQKVWPKVIAEMPEANFYLIGKSDKLFRDEFERIPGVKPLGFVDDLTAVFRGVSAFVVPLHIGGGTRLKILDAMAYGLPIVSTHVGAEGIRLRDNESVVFADSEDDFAEALLRVFKSESLQTALGEGARKLAEQAYNWVTIAGCQNRHILESMQLPRIESSASTEC